MDLASLEKRLRSSSYGEQCQALLLFSWLLDTAPLALLNAALLKLADLFRQTNNNNYVRFCVLRAIRGVTGTPTKRGGIGGGSAFGHSVVNVSEILRRLSVVLHSNDPVARALTLRTLGSCPQLLENNLHIQHSIRDSLDSLHPLELDAAISAIDTLVGVSPVFSSSIIGKVCDKVEGSETSMTTKLKLIRILRHMHHTPHTAQQARQKCILFMQSYPTRGFLLTVMDSLTCLTLKSLLEIPAQIDLLFEILRSDPRLSVKGLALENLNSIARIAPTPHHSFHMEELFHLLQTSLYAGMKSQILQLVRTLSLTMYEQLIAMDGVKICESLLVNDNLELAGLAFEILTNIVTGCYLSKKLKPTPNRSDLAERVIVNACILVHTRLNSHIEKASSFRKVLHCIVKIISCYPEHAQHMTEFTLSLLRHSKAPNDQLEILHFLHMYIKFNPQALFPYLSNLCDFIQEPEILDQPSIVFSVCRCIFSAYQTSFGLHCDLTKKLSPVINTLLTTSHIWSLFLLAKTAINHGFHDISHQVLLVLCPQVESEFNYNWLLSLLYLSQAEAQLKKGSIYNVPPLFRRSHDLLKCLDDSDFQFQKKFLGLRVTFVEELLGLIATLRQVPHSPLMVKNVVPQFVSYSSKFHHLSREYKDLGCNLQISAHRSSFDLLQNCQFSCSLVGFMLDLLLIRGSLTHEGEKSSWTGIPLQLCSMDTESRSSSPMEVACKMISRSLRGVIAQPKQPTSAESSKIVRNFLGELLSVPFSYPSCYFSHNLKT